MLVAYLLYPRFTALDVVGTFQVLAAAPGMQSVFVATEVGPVADDTGLCPLTATSTIADVASADVVVVPGSDCVCDPDPVLVEWLRARAPDDDLDLERRDRFQLPGRRRCPRRRRSRHPLGLGSAADRGRGHLQRPARRPCREGADLCRSDRRHRPGADPAAVSPTARRWPRRCSCPCEYDPQPPYDAGTPAKAPAEIGELVSSYYAQRCS